MNQLLPRPRFWAEAQAQLRTRLSLFGELMLLLLLFFISMFGQSILLSLPLLVWVLSGRSELLLDAVSTGASVESVVNKLLETMPDGFYLITLLAYAVMGAAALIYCRRFQKRSFASMGLCGRAPAAEYFMGLCLGLLLFLAVLGVGAAAGSFRLAPEPVSGERLALAALALLGCIVQGAALELLFRGYFAPTVGARSPVAAALLISTFAALALHGAGSFISLTAANALLLELVLGVLVLKRGSLWCACALHSAWLFAQNYLFCFAPEGEHAGVYLFAVETDGFRTLLTGGEAGPQASICTTVVLLAALAAVLALRPRDPAPPEKQDREQPANYL